MDIGQYEDDVPLERRGPRSGFPSPSRRHDSPPATSSTSPFAQKHVRSERRFGMGLGAGVGAGTRSTQEDSKRPRRIIGDGNIYGHSPTASNASRDKYTDRTENAASHAAHNGDDENHEVEAALALALPTSPITESAPLRVTDARVGVAAGVGDVYGRGVLREGIDPFETGLGLRPGLEAGAAYVLLPPVGAVMLLVLEHRSDYVRYGLDAVSSR